ncbi:radical SAM protein [Enterovirga sp.]|uniref:radical SAM protein n=1 Tax=Enterovirga sp. TaxID=2026350 RepID=UPI002D1FA25D|nr:radical SAM protein [Enterovirga sp.]
MTAAVRINTSHINEWNPLMHFDSMKELFIARKNGDREALKAVPPVTVEIDPVDHCNHACQWCFTASHRETDIMPADAVKRLVIALGRWGVRSVHFAGGGEATLLKNFARLRASFAPSTEPGSETVLDTVAAANMVAGLITNGSTLRILDTAALAEKVSWIRVSIDAGSEQRYKVKHRPKGHTLSDVHRGLEAMVKVRGTRAYPTLGASFIFEENTPEMMEEIRAFARDMANLKIDYIQIKPENFNRGPDAEQFLRMISVMLDEDLAGSTTFATINLPHADADDAKYCWYSHVGPVVGATGDVYACCYTYGITAFKLGNVLSDAAGFDGVWAGDERLRASEAIEPKRCQSCRHTSFNRMADKLYELGEEIWDWLAAELHAARSGKPESEVEYPANALWLRPGLRQFEHLQRSGANSITDYPVFRPTHFINASVPV